MIFTIGVLRKGFKRENVVPEKRTLCRGQFLWIGCGNGMIHNQDVKLDEEAARGDHNSAIEPPLFKIFVTPSGSCLAAIDHCIPDLRINGNHDIISNRIWVRSGEETCLSFGDYTIFITPEPTPLSRDDVSQMAVSDSVTFSEIYRVVTLLMSRVEIEDLYDMLQHLKCHLLVTDLKLFLDRVDKGLMINPMLMQEGDDFFTVRTDYYIKGSEIGVGDTRDLNDGGIHAQILKRVNKDGDADEWIFRNMNGSSGITVNGIPVDRDGSVILSHNDKIIVGDKEWVFLKR
ncbi:MAG: FHA domain-containing protein [Candidatus Aenigmatarchaeota archaeon]